MMGELGIFGRLQIEADSWDFRFFRGAFRDKLIKIPRFHSDHLFGGTEGTQIDLKKKKKLIIRFIVNQ